MAILGNFETTTIQKQSKVILVNYKENYDTGCSKVNDISFGAYSPSNMYLF